MDKNKIHICISATVDDQTYTLCSDWKTNNEENSTINGHFQAHEIVKMANSLLQFMNITDCHVSVHYDDTAWRYIHNHTNGIYNR